MSQTERFGIIVLGSGQGGKLLAWHMARSGRRTAVVERRWIGGSCPNIACLPSKNEIWSARVAHLAQHAARFGTMIAGPVTTDMAKVRERKRDMVDREIALHLQNYKTSGAELIMGAGRFVAPKTLEVQLNDGGTRVLAGGASVYMLMPLPQRGGSMMRISVMLYLATAVGLVFCGYVADNFGWRLIFLPNVVFAAVAIRLLVQHFPQVPRPADARAKAVDKLGILLLGIALISIQVVLSRGEIDDWFGSPRIQLLTWIGLIALTLFVAWQVSSRNRAPLLQLSLIRNRNVQAAISLGLFAGIILSGSIYALPEFLRNVFRYQLSATQAGRIMCVYALTAATIRPLVTKSIARFGQRKAMAFAFTMLVASMLLIARLMTTGTPATYYALPLMLYAFCLAPMLSAIASGTVSKVPLAQQLDAVAIYMSFRQFGASLGVTLVIILLDWRETLHSSRLFESLRDGGPQVQDWMNQAAQFAIARGGYSPAQARQMAVRMLSNEGARQAATLAYADAFLFMAAVGVIALCFVPLMSPSVVVKK